MAVGGTGERPVSPAPAGSRLTVGLYVLALLLACGCIVGAVASVKTHENRAAGKVVQERYGSVLAAASKEAAAFVNIDYRDPQASFDAVAEGATGKFLEQYQASSKSLVELLSVNKSVMTGEVRAAAVTGLDQDSATVIVATNGSVSNVSSDKEKTARDFRMRLDLVYVKGVWLTNNLEFVG